MTKPTDNGVAEIAERWAASIDQIVRQRYRLEDISAELVGAINEALGRVGRDAAMTESAVICRRVCGDWKVERDPDGNRTFHNPCAEAIERIKDAAIGKAGVVHTPTDAAG